MRRLLDRPRPDDVQQHGKLSRLVLRRSPASCSPPLYRSQEPPRSLPSHGRLWQSQVHPLCPSLLHMQHRHTVGYKCSVIEPVTQSPLSPNSTCLFLAGLFCNKFTAYPQRPQHIERVEFGLSTVEFIEPV